MCSVGTQSIWTVWKSSTQLADGREIVYRRAGNKLKYLAGTESGMSDWINDIVPEEAALRLREA
jgi:galactose-1-phosphate uridylyltransferase